MPTKAGRSRASGAPMIQREVAGGRSEAGAGGRVRYSMKAQTSTTNITVRTTAAIRRLFEIGDSCNPYSARVSILSARPKSSSVRPPLLWVESISLTLL